MRYLSLFSGIEAATVAWHPLGWECAAVSEIEPFPCAVLKHHYPDVPNLGDVTKITEEDIKALGHIDVVVFGSPCQDLSVAGHRKGLINADGTVTRSGLFFTAINIARWSGARFWLWENVPGAFSSNKGRDFAAVVEFMAGLDEVPVPAKGWGTEGIAVGDNGLLEWGVLDAQWFGVAQRRRRVFALADLGDWSNRPPILLEPESLRGDSPPSREAGEGASGGATNSAASGKPSIGTLMANAGTKLWLGNQEALSGDYHIIQSVTHSLRGEGFDASEDGTGRGTPLVPVSIFQDSEFGVTQYDSAGTLRAGRIPEHQMVLQAVDAGHVVPVAFSGIDSDNDATRNLAPTLRKGGDGGQGQAMAIAMSMQVRRLTPTECERLQGFPDGYTDIPWRKQPTSPDGPRYKALGNSMAVPVMRWIGNQIQKAIDHENKQPTAPSA